MDEKKEVKKTNTTKKTTAVKKTESAKKPAVKKTTTVKKTEVAKKPVAKKTTTVKKTEVAKKPVAKKTTTVKKTEVAKKPVAKKTTTVKKAEPVKKTTAKKAEPKKVEVETKKDFVDEAMDVVEEIMNTEDTTKKYDTEDIDKHTAISMIAYIGILSLIPYFCVKDSKFTLFNAKQGVNLFILEVLVYLVFGFIGLFTPWFVSRALYYVVCLVFILLSLIGMVNVLNGQARALPYVSKIKFIK